MATATARKAHRVFEYSDIHSAEKRVDREQGVIRGVHIIGLISRNGDGNIRRYYDPDALRRAIPLYEGAEVNIDHPEKASLAKPRPLADRFGVVRNVHFRNLETPDASGLYGDLHYLKSHTQAASVCEAAERIPEKFGLSANHGVVDEHRGNKIVIVEIGNVNSVDIVSRPGTTRDLFESQDAPLSEEDRRVIKMLNKFERRYRAEAEATHPIPDAVKEAAKTKEITRMLNRFAAKYQGEADRNRAARIQATESAAVSKSLRGSGLSDGDLLGAMQGSSFRLGCDLIPTQGAVAVASAMSRTVVESRSRSRTSPQPGSGKTDGDLLSAMARASIRK